MVIISDHRRKMAIFPRKASPFFSSALSVRAEGVPPTSQSEPPPVQLSPINRKCNTIDDFNPPLGGWAIEGYIWLLLNVVHTTSAIESRLILVCDSGGQMSGVRMMMNGIRSAERVALKSILSRRGKYL